VAHQWRIILGFATAPALGLLAFIIAFCAFLLAGASRELPAIGTDDCLLGGTLVFGLTGGLIAYVVMIVLGVPLFRAFRRRAWLRWWQVAAAGLFAGLLAAGCISLWSRASDPRLLLTFCVFFGATGLFSALFFWLVAVFRNRALTTAFSRRPAAAADAER